MFYIIMLIYDHSQFHRIEADHNECDMDSYRSDTVSITYYV